MNFYVTDIGGNRQRQGFLALMSACGTMRFLG